MTALGGHRAPLQRESATMTTAEDVDILLVEDNPNDVELTLRALQKQNLANKVFVVKDGAEALDFIFAAGAFANRKVEHLPKVILLDLKLFFVMIRQPLRSTLFPYTTPLPLAM